MKSIEIKKFKISIHPLFLIVTILMIALGYIEQFFILIIITTIHEFSHIIIGKLFGTHFLKIVLYPIGEVAILENILLIRPIKKMLIICAGPIVNILLGFVFISIGDSDISKFIAVSNFCIGIFNSIPIYPLDGGKLLHLLLENYIGILNANDIILKISKFFIIIIFILGIVQVVLYPYNISIICISVYLSNVIKKEEFNLSIDFFRRIYAKTEIVNKYGFMNTNIITVSEDLCIKQILRYIKSNTICRIYIVDKNLNFLGDTTENQIIEFMIKYGTKANIKKTIKI